MIYHRSNVIWTLVRINFESLRVRTERDRCAFHTVFRVCFSKMTLQGHGACTIEINENCGRDIEPSSVYSRRTLGHWMVNLNAGSLTDSSRHDVECRRHVVTSLSFSGDIVTLSACRHVTEDLRLLIWTSRWSEDSSMAAALRSRFCRWSACARFSYCSIVSSPRRVTRVTRCPQWEKADSRYIRKGTHCYILDQTSLRHAGHASAVSAN